MEKTAAPYASIPIPLSLTSVSGLKYRTLNCLECGRPFMERNNEVIYRTGTNTYPTEVKLDAAGQIKTNCGQCSQEYIVAIAITVATVHGALPLNEQPMSIFIASAPTKKLRDTYCLECGHAYFSISDRITSLVDDVVPIEMIKGMGPMEPRCKFHHCKQRYHVRV
jgi:hypothetical protein